MESHEVTSFRKVLRDLDIQQKEIAHILGITESAVSKKIKNLSISLDELILISNTKNKNIFHNLSDTLKEPLRNVVNHKETKSPIEIAILNLVRQNIK